MKRPIRGWLWLCAFLLLSWQGVAWAGTPLCTINGGSGSTALTDCSPAGLAWGSPIAGQSNVYVSPTAAANAYYAYMTNATPSLCQYGCDLSVAGSGTTAKIAQVVSLKVYNSDGSLRNNYVPQTNASGICPPGGLTIRDYDAGGQSVFMCRPATTAQDAIAVASSPDAANTCGCENGYNPVNLGDLNKADDVVDYHNQSPYPIVWSRHWSGRVRQWIFNYDRRLSGSTVVGNDHQASLILRRQDGQLLAFTGTLSGTTWTWVPSMKSALRSAMVLMSVQSNTALTQFAVVNHLDETETYNAQGLLVSLQDPRGLPLTFTYDDRQRLVRIDDASGRYLTLTHTDDGASSSITVQAHDGTTTQGTFHPYTNATDLLTSQMPEVVSDGTRMIGYVMAPNPAASFSPPMVLTQVIKPDNTTLTYNYDSQSNYAGVTDEDNQRYTTYTYNSGKVYQTMHGANQELVTYSGSSIKYPNNQTNSFSKDGGSLKMTSQTLACPWCTGTQYKSLSYDTAGNPTSLTDFDNHVETRTYDLVRGVPLTITEASGTAQARTTTLTWDSRFLKPATVTTAVQTPQGVGQQVVTNTYDNAGNLTAWSAVVTGPGGYSLSRSGSATYNALGEPLTLTDARHHTTTYTYDSVGNRLTAVDALNHTLTYGGYDTAGNVGWVEDANGLRTQFTYDAMQRITQIQRGCDPASGGGCHWETTTITYDPTGLVAKVTGPNGRGLGYHYDTAHRRNQVDVLDTDGTTVLGSEVDTFNASSEITARVFKDAAGTTLQTQGLGYDTLSRVTAFIDSHSKSFTQTWDAQSNLATTSDPLNHGRTLTYDALDRWIQTTLPDSTVESQGYGPDDTVISQTDAKGNSTTQTYNGFGEVLSRTSPDSGLTSFTRDANGNTLTRTDARGVVMTSTYDALDRPLTQSGSTGGAGEQITWTYDTCQNGVGHLCSLTDRTGSTAFTYDRWGRRTSQTQVTSSHTFTTLYGYDTAGQLTSITYPSGQVLTQIWAHGRVVSQQWGSAIGSGPSILTAAQYDPWDKLQGWTWASGRGFSIGYDLDGRVSAIGAGGGAASQTYTYDDAWRLTGITRQPANQLTTFGYDNRDRLTSGTTWGSYTYDANSNRLSWLGTLGPLAYTYGSTNNRLATWNGTTTSVDAAGNLLARPGLSLSYDDWSRLRTATANGVTTTYGVNGLNERVSKTDGTTRRVFVYAGVGHLLGVYDGTTGAAIEELAYLGERPVATVRSGTIYPIETDHLMAPLRVLDGTNAVLWSWEDREPFGASAPTTSGFAFNLRFPGQWLDGETGLVSNGFRDYDPVMGRYVEVDPLGLMAGGNPYIYAAPSPLVAYDEMGTTAKVTVIGNNVNINLPISYGGPGAQLGITSEINKTIEDTWSGNFGKYHVITHVVSGSENTVNIMFDSDLSRVYRFNYGVWNLRRPDGSLATTSVFAHEAGHLMGIGDKYTDCYIDGNRIVTPLPGYENDIMGHSNKLPSERDIDDVLKSPSNDVYYPFGGIHE